MSGNFLEDWFRSTAFLQSCQTPAQLPHDSGREVAFAGRSNAGKSSAINAITGQKGLARASKTPGRTRLLNFFTLDSEHRLVDLPGYGYAEVARAEKDRWQEALAYYLEERRSLAGVILVMDARHPLTDFDSQLLSWAQTKAMPMYVLLTKADKFGRGAAGAQLSSVQTALHARFPDVDAQLFSALKGMGVDMARTRIGAWLELSRSAPRGGSSAGATHTRSRKSKKSPGNKGKESGAQKKSRHRGRDLPRSGRRSG